MSYEHIVLEVRYDDRLLGIKEYAQELLEDFESMGYELVTTLPPTHVTPMLLFMKRPREAVELDVKLNDDGTASFEKEALVNAAVADLEYDLAKRRG